MCILTIYIFIYTLKDTVMSYIFATSKFRKVKHVGVDVSNLTADSNCMLIRLNFIQICQYLLKTDVCV